MGNRPNSRSDPESHLERGPAPPMGDNPRSMEEPRRSGSSFRDPSGFVYSRGGVIYRQVHGIYEEHYRALMDSGLYEELSESGKLTRHTEMPLAFAFTNAACRVLKPETVPFVSYPYEWSFSQLQDAALLTLDIQLRALGRGMCLKDAAAYNVQFVNAKPVFIDTLSFERYRDGEPWIAYRQFCQHFLAPLLMMDRLNTGVGRLLGTYLDGIPLDLASDLLRRRTWLSPSILVHVHLHARSIARYGGRHVPERAASRGVTLSGLKAILADLERCVGRLSWSGRSEWAQYTVEHGYEAAAFEEKARIVGEMLRTVSPSSVWDLGANTGLFSRYAADIGAQVVAIDADHGAVDRHYVTARDEGIERVLPIWVDVSNPSPSLGWNHSERLSLEQRGPADLISALALVHHLAISNNLPLTHISEWMANIGRWAVVEFVPKMTPRPRDFCSHERTFSKIIMSKPSMRQ